MIHSRLLAMVLYFAFLVAGSPAYGNAPPTGAHNGSGPPPTTSEEPVPTTVEDEDKAHGRNLLLAGIVNMSVPYVLAFSPYFELMCKKSKDNDCPNTMRDLDLSHNYLFHLLPIVGPWITTGLPDSTRTERVWSSVLGTWQLIGLIVFSSSFAYNPDPTAEAEPGLRLQYAAPQLLNDGVLSVPGVGATFTF
ncbi:MAG: hypothetical protein IV100_31425 [Myxococcales bacterium]|nr:hypothetical protein [Myxococcales bacterium]